MVQVSTHGAFADGYGMGIVGISRRDVADIHFSPCRHRNRHMESRNSDTTMNEEKRLSIGNHIFVLMMTCKPSPTGVQER
jgi:hypothetical protein